MERIKDIEKIFEFINHMPESVKKELPYYPFQILKNISMLPDTIADGDVYKIHLEGDLNLEGYEKSLLYLIRGSMIKKHTHITESEWYVRLKGVMVVDGIVSDVHHCDITDSHSINSVVEDTVVLSYKYK